jgi:hypothetical protein
VIRQTDQLPVVLTSFAFREEYFDELDGMLATAKQHHSDWSFVVGKGSVSASELPALDVQSPLGKQRWSLPVPLNLDGSADDWRKINKMKAWWIARVWHSFGDLAGDFKRILWIDADARMKRPLDIQLDPQSEVIAGAWWRDARYPGYDTITSGLLLFQGTGRGTIETILQQWSTTCLGHIAKLPHPPLVPWGDGDQEVLTQILKTPPRCEKHYILIRLDADKYCAVADKDGLPPPGDAADQCVMMRRPGWLTTHSRTH